MDTLSFPLNFLSRPNVKFLGHHFGDENIVFRLWVDFALSKSDFRVVKFKTDAPFNELKPSDIDFDTCPAMWQINDACISEGRTSKNVATFIESCIENGVLQIVEESGVIGLRLIDFEKSNPQYFPSRQTRGGYTKGVNVDAKNAAAIAESQMPLFAKLSESDSIDATGEQLEKAHALLNQIHRALGDREMTIAHDNATLIQAVSVTDEFDAGQIKVVCTNLVAGREDPKIDRRIAVILTKFATYL